MDTATRSNLARQVSQHRAALSWWVQAQHAFPLGLVPQATASRILGVSHRRLRSLVEEGRIRLIGGMPGGTSRDQFVPLVDLIDAPFVLNRGQPGVFGPTQRFSQDFLDRDTYRGKRISAKGLRKGPREVAGPGAESPSARPIPPKTRRKYRQDKDLE